MNRESSTEMHTLLSVKESVVGSGRTAWGAQPGTRGWGGGEAEAGGVLWRLMAVQRGLASCSPWGCKESDMTKPLTHG